MTVAVSSHSTPRAVARLPQQPPAEGEFGRMSDMQMTESHSVFLKLYSTQELRHIPLTLSGFSQARHYIGVDMIDTGSQTVSM